jgi:2-keto-3-deoxy-L-rhamnonate aldolase RhmA/quercetin dioxygenase-like cupin family protein
MKTSAIRALRRKLAADEPVLGLWVTLESASVTEMAVALGLDWVVIDAEHGHLDWKEIVEHLRATVRSDTVALVRLAELNGGLVKRALDIGADGVVIPWMESAEQLRQAVAFAHYPPDGRRGIGAERATAWGQCIAQHVAEAEANVLVVPIIESVRGGQAIQELCSVPGVDLFFLGPADYSATAGSPGQWEGPGVAEQLLAILDVIRKHGKHCGVMATSNDNLRERIGQGFRMLGVGMDAGLLLRGLRGALACVGRDRPLNPSLSAGPLEAVPEGIHPDRPEVMTRAEDTASVEISPGIVFHPLAGAHNQARNLTTGLVIFDPAAQLPYHLHSFTESVTLLSGTVVVEVEGRRHVLEPFDNVTVPRQTPHGVVNLSATQPAVLHIAMASSTPTRTLVERPAVRQDVPPGSPTPPGKERVNRHGHGARFEAGSGAQLEDWFNRALGPFEMSGGYGLFAPGGRLPCHLHDFDESITIVEGEATCIVEGRRYRLSGNATALVPRGRCHYFINEGNRPMVMIWVYAGPMPERIVLAERCCTGS